MTEFAAAEIVRGFDNPAERDLHMLAGIAVATAESYLRGTLGAGEVIRLSFDRLDQIAILSERLIGQSRPQLLEPVRMLLQATLRCTGGPAETDGDWRKITTALAGLVRKEAARARRIELPHKQQKAVEARV